MEPTEEQKKVIQAHRGQIVVEACPGSGKTATLVKRCGDLPYNESKLVLAFNKKAAEEFSSRLGTLPNCDVRTLHSFCFREVMGSFRKYGFRKHPKLTDAKLFELLRAAHEIEARGWEEAGWLEEDVKEYEHSWYTEDLESWVKLNRPPFTKMDVAALENRRGDALADDRVDAHDKEVAEKKALLARWNTASAVLRYRAFLIENGLVTFASMVRLVAENAEFLGFAADHVMVDEFQDVDRFQYDIAAALGKARGTKSLVCVGDPRQRIYEWRGALMDAFEEFRSDFENAQTLTLTQNFRSTHAIVAHAETVCPVGMKASHGRPGDESVQEFPKDPLSALLDLSNSFDDLSNLAILCRTNRSALKWQLDLAKSKHPVYLIGKGDFWATPHIRLARKYWQKKMPGTNPESLLMELLSSQEWNRIAMTKRFLADPELLEEAESDVSWVLSLTDSDMAILERTMQREDTGLRISTIHRTKGMEWDGVMVSGVNERLKAEKFVYYVAVTRPRKRLILS